MLAEPSARLFLALIPGAAVRARLADHVQAWGWTAEVARYAPSDWHLTLHFLGALPRSRLDALGAALDLPIEPFALRFGVPALWPQGLAVLLPLDLPPALRQLHEGLGARLRALGLRTDERPYRPHLTLARHAAQARPPAPPDWRWAVRDYALVESTGRPEARYRLLRRYGGAASAHAPQA